MEDVEDTPRGHHGGDEDAQRRLTPTAASSSRPMNDSAAPAVPTVDGTLPAPKARKMARRLYILGFFCLPACWALNASGRRQRDPNCARSSAASWPAVAPAPASPPLPNTPRTRHGSSGPRSGRVRAGATPPWRPTPSGPWWAPWHGRSRCWLGAPGSRRSMAGSAGPRSKPSTGDGCSLTSWGRGGGDRPRRNGRVGSGAGCPVTSTQRVEIARSLSLAPPSFSPHPLA